MTQLLDHLRQKHRRFLYHGYTVALEKRALIFGFDFEIEPGIRFSPEVVVRDINQQRVSRLRPEVLNNLAFHLGLMEIPSYWKATCSPEIVIRAGSLDEYQISWWKRLLLRGLGEFFYNNDINFAVPDFVTFKIGSDIFPQVRPYESQLDSDRVLVPIGGGKDSAVTCELLKRANKRTACWSLNPTRASLEIIRVSQSQQSIIVTRSIDDTLLRLNEEGYLNGHTPFSAYLAFSSTACAVLFGYKNVVVSNERSSNEGNVTFQGREINHQYSKSFEFEEGFREYSQRYLAREVNYFSLLRPLYELQIARGFSQFPQYFPGFRSCNRGQKTNSWCQECEKCLFVFTILYPFVEDEILTTTIFSENLFEKEELIETAHKLLGWGEKKPFECVGTMEETAAAFHLCLKKAEQRGESLPPVLRSVREKIVVGEHDLEERTLAILRSWDVKHAIPRDLEELLAREVGLWQS